MGVPYEGNGYAALPFLTWVTSVEIILLVFSLAVLGVALLMFVRLFDALSPPTKALTWVVGGNFALAFFVVAFACMQMHYYARKEFIPQGGAFCHYFNPVVLALIVFGWLGQPVIAWTTLKTLRNEAVPDRTLRRIYLGCIAVAFSNYLWGVTLSPGVIVNGSFCVMIPKTPDAVDARSMANFLGVATLVWSVVLYAKSYRHLKRLRNKLAKDLKKMRPASTEAPAAMEEGKEQQQLELSSLGQASSMLSRSGGPFWGTEGGSGSSALGADVESGARSGGGGGVGGLGGEESSEYDSDEDSEDDAPFTYKELRARTQAARAAVNILLPNRTDDMAEREGPYGMRRRWRGEGQRLLEEGVDLSALMEPQMQPTSGPFLGSHLPPSQQLQQQQQQPPPSDLDETTAAATAAAASTAAGAAEGSPAPAKWWQVWRRCSRNAGGGKSREEDPNAEVVALCSKAMRAVLGRGCTLMIVYYLPSYVLFACMGAYKDFRPPANILPIFALIFFLGTPVLQTVALLHIGVTVGSNILQFYRQYVAQHEEGEEAEQAVAAGAAQDEAGGYAIELTPGTTGERERLDGAASRSSSSSGTGFLYEQGAAAAEGPTVLVVHGGMGGGADDGPAVGWGTSVLATTPPTAATAAPGGPSGSSSGGRSSPPLGGAGSLFPMARTAAGAAMPLQSSGSSSSGSGRPAPGPLGVPQPSAFKRFAGRRQKPAPPRPASRQGHMQALSTIYEVAFKSRGRDAAAAFRHSMAASASPAPPAGAEGVAAAAIGEEGAEQEGAVSGGERKSSDGDDGSSSGDSSGGKSVRASDVATLQQNALLQEMLGVKMRGSSGGGSSSSCNSSVSGSSSLASGSAASSLSGDASGSSGGAEGKARAGGPYASYFPWRSLVRSRSMSQADNSEISSLTDAQDYQIGSLGTSPALTPWGQKALSPSRPVKRGAGAEGGGLRLLSSVDDEGGTSSENPSSSSSSSASGHHQDDSMNSWAEHGPQHGGGNKTNADVFVGGGGGGGGAYGGGASVAGMTHVSGSSGASSEASLVSDGGRSIVTESDYREWMQQHHHHHHQQHHQQQQQHQHQQAAEMPN